LRLPSRSARLSVGPLSVAELSAQAVQLTTDVERRAQGTLARRLGQTITRPLHLHPRGRPRTGEQHQLGPVDQTLAAIEHHFRLRIAPAAQRRRPLPSPAHVEHLLAALDRGAIQVSDHHRRNLLRRDRHHRLVEQRHALGDLAAIDQAPALTDPAQCNQLRVTEPVTDRGCLSKPGKAGLDVAFERRVERSDVPHVAPLDTIRLTFVEQTLPPVHPTAAVHQLALVQQDERQPERAAGGARDITCPQTTVVRTPPRVHTVIHLANQVRGGSEQFHIRELQAPLTVCVRENLKRLPPLSPRDARTTSIDRVGHRQILAQPASSRGN
jgi:hypothetical protein